MDFAGLYTLRHRLQRLTFAWATLVVIGVAAALSWPEVGSRTPPPALPPIPEEIPMEPWIAGRALADLGACSYWILMSDAFPPEGTNEGRELLIAGKGWDPAGLLVRSSRPGQAQQAWRIPVQDLTPLLEAMRDHYAAIAQRPTLEQETAFRTLQSQPQTLRPFRVTIKIQPRTPWTNPPRSLEYRLRINSTEIGRHRAFITAVGTLFDHYYAGSPQPELSGRLADLVEAAHSPRKHGFTLSLHRPVPAWPPKEPAERAGYERLVIEAPRMPNMYSGGYALEYWADPEHKYRIEPTSRTVLEHLVAGLAAAPALDQALEAGAGGAHGVPVGPGGDGIAVEFQTSAYTRGTAPLVGQCAVTSTSDPALYAALEELFEQVTALVAAEVVPPED